MGKYDARKENFIQKLSLTRNISNSEARKFYREEYENASDANRRKIMKQTKNKIKELYPENTPHPSRDDKKTFKKPKIKKSKTKKSKVKKSKTKKSKRKIISKGKQYNSDTFKRVQNAKKKYPNASDYELRHGVNSKASQKYRENQNKKYMKNELKQKRSNKK